MLEARAKQGKQSRESAEILRQIVSMFALLPILTLKRPTAFPPSIIGVSISLYLRFHSSQTERVNTRRNTVGVLPLRNLGNITTPIGATRAVLTSNPDRVAVHKTYRSLLPCMRSGTHKLHSNLELQSARLAGPGLLTVTPHTGRLTV